MANPRRAPIPHLTNKVHKVCNKETNGQMLGRNIRLGWDSN